jgi:asparagine synthase (glutamine-hydrolysing)
VCGISAILRISDAPSDALRAMHGDLAHRGPDGEGFLFVDDALQARRTATLDDDAAAHARLSIAFRRLRIIDLHERADAPLRRGNRWIVLNGEIYNYCELRARLESEGFAFATASDTEVALAAYERWGTGAFAEMRGMWAILIADLDRGVLIGSRDRIGIKPLFYAFDGDRLLFASEPKTIARANGAGIDMARFAEFLRGLPPRSASGSMFAGVGPVPAGTWFEIDLRDPRPPRFRRFWDLANVIPSEVEGSGRVGRTARATHPDPSTPLGMTGGLHTEELHELLRETVALHMVADVPVGMLLSGGLDSSVIARLIAATRNGAAPPRTFTLTHADPRIDESRFARTVAAMGGVDPSFDAFSPEAGWAAVDRVIAAQGEPLLGFDLIGHYRMFELARAHGVPVVLDGLGSDEIFGGYPFYDALHLVDRLKRFRIASALQDARASARRSGRSLPRLVASYARAASRNTRGPARPPWLAHEPATPRPAEPPPMDSALNRLLYEQVVETNLQSTMLHQDRNSMAHSIESRLPYLDHRVVELAFRLPVEWKIHRGERKRVLLEVARKLLPPEITERRDKKAIISSPDWIDLRAHREELEEMARGRALRECALIDGPRMQRFVADYLARRHHDTPAVWRLYTASRWLEQFHPPS